MRQTHPRFPLEEPVRHIPTRTLAVSAAALGLIAVGGIAGATIPGTGGVINGCYNTTNGALRVIDTATTTCKQGETPITWNQTGTPGTNGDDGDNGAAGANGVSGYEIVPASGDSNTTIGSSGLSETAICPAGKVVVGGGGSHHHANVSISKSYPITDAQGSRWVVEFGHRFPPTFDGTLPVLHWEVYAVCINAN
jgi:hypothetical protein